MKKSTIYDVAKEAGVSTATVSRVLSGSGYPVKDGVREKVLKASNKLNYTINIVGRMLKKSDSLDIGVIIPTISNPFYSQIILGIEFEARQRGYNILLCNSLRNPDTEKKYIQSLYQKQVRGIIISSIGENHSFINEIQQNGVNIVAFDQDIDINCSKVSFDYKKGGLLATDYLINQGHNNIAFLTSPLITKNRKDTLEGYKQALINNGIKFNPGNVIVSDTEQESVTTYEFENGKRLAKRFLDITPRPTAIFAINDMTAFGIIQELSNNSISVPEDVSVMGFDNIEMAGVINPPLTTINQPAFETGRQSCKILLDSMAKENENISITLEPTLIIRKSVKHI